MFAGSIAWREHVSDDRQAATAFYHDLIGWEIEAVESDHSADPYRMIKIGDTRIGGFETSDGSDMSPHWLVYIQVPDSVEAATARAVARGAHVHREPQDLHGIGRYAIFADPAGAIVAAVDEQRPTTTEETWPPQPGTISWYAVAGPDLAQTADFYANVFGYTPPDPDEVFSVTNTPVLIAADKLHAGVLPSSDNLPPTWVPYIVVTNIADASKRIPILGGTLTTPIMSVPHVGKILGIRDPLGAPAFLHQPEDLA